MTLLKVASQHFALLCLSSVLTWVFYVHLVKGSRYKREAYTKTEITCVHAGNRSFDF